MQNIQTNKDGPQENSIQKQILDELRKISMNIGTMNTNIKDIKTNIGNINSNKGNINSNIKSMNTRLSTVEGKINSLTEGNNGVKDNKLNRKLEPRREEEEKEPKFNDKDEFRKPLEEEPKFNDKDEFKKPLKEEPKFNERKLKINKVEKDRYQKGDDILVNLHYNKKRYNVPSIYEDLYKNNNITFEQNKKNFYQEDGTILNLNTPNKEELVQTSTHSSKYSKKSVDTTLGKNQTKTKINLLEIKNKRRNVSSKNINKTDRKTNNAKDSKRKKHFNYQIKLKSKKKTKKLGYLNVSFNIKRFISLIDCIYLLFN